jgi:predicted nucleic acid-binding protein
MVCYVDTSALVALCVKEPKSDDVTRWYTQCKDELVSSVWCVTEFASALGIKQRTGQITSDQANAAWLRFERLCANDLQLLPAEPATFHKAALMTLDAATGLRAGDALHLAAALDAKVKHMLTLDGMFARNAKKMKIGTVEI